MRNLASHRVVRRLLASLSLGGMLAGAMALGPNPAHLSTAEMLVANMRAQGERGLFNAPNGMPLNQYGAGWPNAMISVASPARTYARCSSFVTLVLMMSNPGWTASNAGMGSASPTAAMYHDAIEASVNGFKKVGKFSNVRAGDLLMVKYADPDDDTGHAMIVRDFAASDPDVNGVVTWTVQVIDCSKSVHSEDTRVFNVGVGTTVVTNGAGMGKIRVFTKNDKIVGYAWSLSGGTIYLPEDRHMTLGRFQPA